MRKARIAPMLDPDIRRLLDTLFNLPAPPGPPDVERLRAAAEAAPKVLGGPAERSEEHTSELQSRRDLVCRLLLEKKKKKKKENRQSKEKKIKEERRKKA